jgi:predicted nucleic acid-binding Zn ribbon protein
MAGNQSCRRGDPKRENPRGPEPVAAILKRWLSTQSLPQRLKEEGIYGGWRAVVGEEIAAQTRVAKLSGGVLTVEVSSAPLLQELSSYLKEEILGAIRSHPEFGGIREIRFRPGQGQAQPTQAVKEGKEFERKR